MGLFGRRKKKKIEDEENLNGELEFAEEAAVDEKGVGRFVLGHCEQIIEAAKDLSLCKNEYKKVTDYLTDIEIISDLEDRDAEAIKEYAKTLNRLKQGQQTYLNSNRNISDAQYEMIDLRRDEIPGVIDEMRANETYQDAVKRDMKYLEGEKLSWTMQRKEALDTRGKLRIASYIAISIFFSVGMLLLVLSSGFRVNTTWGWLLLIFFGALAGFYIVIKYISTGEIIKKSRVNANNAIALLNRIKIKYVNITNAVDYAHEKYHVRSAMELERQWEEYTKDIREREKFERANDDIDYYSEKLLQALKRQRLYDSRIWLDRTKAILDNNEMSLIKHEYIVRRQKLRSRIEYDIKVVKEERGHIDRLMKLHPEYEKEIKEIISSVDVLAGKTKEAEEYAKDTEGQT